MTAIRTYANPIFGQIRAIKSSDEKPLFVAKDVATALGYSNTRKAISDHCKGGNEMLLPTPGGKQSTIVIPESDVYRLIMRSKLPQAEAFQDWVTEEVLPSIRKSGGYMVSNGNESPEEIMARALVLAQETLQRHQQRIIEQEEQISKLAPKALFADAVTTSNDSILVGELARYLNQNGVNIGQNRLFEWLRQNGYLCVKGELYNQPTQKAMAMGLFEVKKTSITKPDGTVLVSSTSKVTGKGQVYFLNKFLNQLNN
ncbi:phage antirepressor KilAC domain-containing protein [Leadbetterella byssophila]|uniref:phage antirepressor KilAC domain-containing protein n=1 Tax=Leadbetterella byssophila TaxID=316068 RepID=UPI00399F9472